MQKTSLARAIAGALVFAAAQHAGAQEDAVVITGAPAASVLHGQSLMLKQKSSLGETLDGQPGVSSTYFGPAASRPVIRGLDGDRIRILQNGTGALDASALSFDHAVPYDPLVAERIEILRGPAAVLYGGNAIGGVVNLIDNRIPQAPLTGVSGRVEPRFGGADREKSIGAVLEAGNGSLAIHGDVFNRTTRDLRTPVRTLVNSSARSDGATLGGSFTGERGYIGVSHGAFWSNYGSIPEPGVRIDMQSNRTDIAGELRERVKFKLSHTDYGHREIESGRVNTTFRNKGNEARAEVKHGKLGPLEGTVGLSFNDFGFSALGAESFVPQTYTRSRGVFLHEELPLGDWKLSGGVRSERSRVSTDALSRTFGATSSAFGALYNWSESIALSANGSFTQRAPTFYELYANGPHAATGVYEVGNSAFEKEKSRSIDAGVRWRSGGHSASVSAFRTRFSNFIVLANSGNTRGADGELNPADADGDNVADGSGEEIQPEAVYQAVPAVFRGFEAQARLRVHERVHVLLRADYVKAQDRSTGQPLPRIAPLRLGAGLEYSFQKLTAGLDVQRVKAQNDVAPNETRTPGYTLVNASLIYGFSQQPIATQAFLRINNLLDKEARSHVSFQKDAAPLPGRGVLVGLRASF